LQGWQESERKDVTDEAKKIHELLTQIADQKKGRGVTMAQLSELYRGSKSQSATKFLNTSRLKGYGAGSKLKKYEIDRITYAMVFERLLVETSVANAGGFSSDYISHAENSSAVLNGSRKFFVEVPRAQASRKTGQSKSASKTKSKETPSNSKEKRRRSAKTASNDCIEIDSGLQFTENGVDSDPDDDLKMGSSFSRSTKPDYHAVLPFNQTKKLVENIKQLTVIWAQEEQLMGNQVFCKFCIVPYFTACSEIAGMN
jgi:superfamily II DNA helicase RecQ